MELGCFEETTLSALYNSAGSHSPNFDKYESEVLYFIFPKLSDGHVEVGVLNLNEYITFESEFSGEFLSGYPP